MASGIEKPEDFIGCPIPLSEIKYIGLFRGDIDFLQSIAKPINFQLGSILDGYGAT